MSTKFPCKKQKRIPFVDSDDESSSIDPLSSDDDDEIVTHPYKKMKLSSLPLKSSRQSSSQYKKNKKFSYISSGTSSGVSENSFDEGYTMSVSNSNNNNKKNTFVLNNPVSNLLKSDLKISHINTKLNAILELEDNNIVEIDGMKDKRNKGIRADGYIDSKTQQSSRSDRFGENWRSDLIEREKILENDPTYQFLSSIAGHTESQITELISERDHDEIIQYNKRLEADISKERDRINVSYKDKMAQIDFMKNELNNEEALYKKTMNLLSYYNSLATRGTMLMEYEPGITKIESEDFYEQTFSRGLVFLLEFIDTMKPLIDMVKYIEKEEEQQKKQSQTQQQPTIQILNKTFKEYPIVLEKIQKYYYTKARDKKIEETPVEDMVFEYAIDKLFHYFCDNTRSDGLFTITVKDSLRKRYEYIIYDDKLFDIGTDSSSGFYIPRINSNHIHSLINEKDAIKTKNNTVLKTLNVDDTMKADINALEFNDFKNRMLTDKLPFSDKFEALHVDWDYYMGLRLVNLYNLFIIMTPKTELNNPDSYRAFIDTIIKRATKGLLLLVVSQGSGKSLDWESDNYHETKIGKEILEKLYKNKRNLYIDKDSDKKWLILSHCLYLDLSLLTTKNPSVSNNLFGKKVTHKNKKLIILNNIVPIVDSMKACGSHTPKDYYHAFQCTFSVSLLLEKYYFILSSDYMFRILKVIKEHNLFSLPNELNNKLRYYLDTEGDDDYTVDDGGTTDKKKSSGLVDDMDNIKESKQVTERTEHGITTETTTVKKRAVDKKKNIGYKSNVITNKQMLMQQPSIVSSTTTNKKRRKGEQEEMESLQQQQQQQSMEEEQYEYNFDHKKIDANFTYIVNDAFKKINTPVIIKDIIKSSTSESRSNRTIILNTLFRDFLINKRDLWEPNDSIIGEKLLTVRSYVKKFGNVFPLLFPHIIFIMYIKFMNYNLDELNNKIEETKKTIKEGKSILNRVVKEEMEETSKLTEKYKKMYTTPVSWALDPLNSGVIVIKEFVKAAIQDSFNDLIKFVKSLEDIKLSTIILAYRFGCGLTTEFCSLIAVRISDNRQTFGSQYYKNIQLEQTMINKKRIINSLKQYTYIKPYSNYDKKDHGTIEHHGKVYRIIDNTIINKK